MGIKRKQSLDGGSEVKAKASKTESPAGKKKFVNKLNDKKKGKDSSKPLEKDTAKSRRERKQARQMKKPKYELTQACKKIWEKLRIHKNENSKEKNYELIDQLLKLIKEKDMTLLKVAYAHDTSRILQCCLKDGSKAQRESIYEELKEEVVSLSKNKYAKNIVMNLIRYGTKERRGEIVQKFKGQVYNMMRKNNELGSSVIEFLYNDYCNKDQRHQLLREMLGKVYIMHPKSDNCSFEEVLGSLEKEEDKKSMLSSFQQAIMPFIGKKVVKMSIIHKVFYEFFKNCSFPEIRREVIEPVRDSLIHMIHTHDGAHATMSCLWHGTKKDRKAILKTMKELACKIAQEEQGYLTILAAFDCVDDTVFLEKALIKPLLKSIPELMSSPRGLKVIHYLMSPRDTSYFLTQVIDDLKQGDDNVISKKDMATRHSEIQDKAAQPLIAWMKDNCRELVFDRTRFGAVEAAVVRFQRKNGELVKELASELASVAVQEFVAGEKDKKGNLHIAEHPSGHLLMRKIIKGESKLNKTDDNSEDNEEAKDSVFSQILMDKVGGEKLASWASCNRGSLVLLDLLNSEDSKVASKCKQLLQPHATTISSFEDVKSAKLVAEKLM